MAIAVTFPTDNLLEPHPEGTQKKPLLVIGAAPAGKAVQIGIFFSRERPTTLERRLLQVGTPIYHWDMLGGEAVWLVARETNFDLSSIPTPE